MARELFDFKNKTEQHQSMLIFNIYRISLVTIVILSDLFRWQGIHINPEQELFFLGSCALYVCLTFGAIFFAGKQALFNKIAIVHASLDLAFLLILAQSVWGASNLFPIFMNLSILGNGIILPVFFIIPYILIVMLSTLGYYHYFQTYHDVVLLQQVMWVISFFITGIVIRLLVGHLRKTESIAKAQGEQLFNLEKMNELIINHFDEGVLLIDASGVIRLINDAAKRSLGFSDNDLSYQLEDLPKKIQHHLKVWKMAKMCSENESVFPVFNGLRLKFFSLGDQAYSATAVFLEDTSVTVEKAQSMKLASLGRFTASIAHELRNPLGAVSHAAQLLAENREFKESEGKLVTIIHNQSNRMNQIIKNILQLSRRSQPSQTEFNLVDFIKEFFERYQNGSKVPVQFQLEVNIKDTLVEFDTSQLEQIFINLCENSIRSAHENQIKPKIKFSIEQSHYGSDVILKISDNGQGFEPGKYTHLFEPFFTTDRQGGTGLGLYLCKELCEANRAIIKAQKPVEGEGATIKIQFRRMYGVAQG